MSQEYNFAQELGSQDRPGVARSEQVESKVTAPHTSRGMAVDYPKLSWPVKILMAVGGLTALRAIACGYGFDNYIPGSLTAPVLLSELILTVSPQSGFVRTVIMFLPTAIAAFSLLLLSREANKFHAWAFVLSAFLLCADAVLLWFVHMPYKVLVLHAVLGMTLVHASYVCIKTNRQHKSKVAIDYSSPITPEF